MSGKNRKDKSEVERRVYAVQQWLLQDFSAQEIILAGKKKWEPISDRQIERYIMRAREGFKETLQQSIEARKAYYVKRKQKLIREIDPEERKTAKGIMAVSRILDSIAEMEGIKVRRHEITGKDGKPIETTAKVTNDIDYTQLPTEVLQAIIKARKKHID